MIPIKVTLTNKSCISYDISIPVGPAKNIPEKTGKNLIFEKSIGLKVKPYSLERDTSKGKVTEQLMPKPTDPKRAASLNICM